MKNVKALLFIGVVLGATTACKTIKPYEKEFLLNPLMDDKRTTDLTPIMPSAGTSNYEKFATGIGGGAGTSCPTCGG